MRKLLTTVGALAALAYAGSAQAADGVVDMGWNSCNPTTTNIGPIPDGSTSGADLWVSVLGLDQPHKSYEFQVIYGNATTRVVPDAWQFDAIGCQAGAGVTLEHTAPAKTCPSLQGTISPNFQIKTIARDGLAGPQYDPAFMHITYANAYPNGGAGNTTEINPAVRYFLGRIRFSHEFSVAGAGDPPNTCGGLDQSICFALTSANYVNLADQQVGFGQGGIRGVTVNSSLGCPATPARNATWGQIKGQYRM